jgi:hypothetical protein
MPVLASPHLPSPIESLSGLAYRSVDRASTAFNGTTGRITFRCMNGAACRLGSGDGLGYPRRAGSVRGVDARARRLGTEVRSGA